MHASDELLMKVLIATAAAATLGPKGSDQALSTYSYSTTLTSEGVNLANTGTRKLSPDEQRAHDKAEYELMTKLRYNRLSSIPLSP